MPEPLLERTAVVTVSYNSSAQLALFLASIRESDAAGVGVIVVDNRSADIEATRAICETYAAHLIELDDNRGYGGAINAAVETLPPEIEFVLISNPDVLVHENSIPALVRLLEAEKSVGAIGPTVLNSDGTVYPSARRLPSLRTGIGHALFARVWPANPWSRAYRNDAEGYDKARYVGWLSGSFVLVRRAAFESIGKFDEGYFMYFEDVDMGYRMGKTGWRSLYTPSATVTHSGAHSTNTESAKMIKTHHESANRYLAKKYAGPVLAPLRLALRVGLSARSMYLSRAARKSDRG